MQDIQVMRAIIRKQRRDERVRHGLKRAVGQAENERAHVKQDVSGILRHPGGGAESDEGGKQVEGEGGDDEFTVADLVAQQSANDDAETEAGKASPVDIAQLGGGEPEITAPVREDAAANSEANARRQDGGKAGPEEAFCVWCNTVAGSVTHSFVG